MQMSVLRIQDESVFLFGTKGQQAIAQAQWDSVIEAMKRVLYVAEGQKLEGTIG